MRQQATTDHPRRLNRPLCDRKMGDGIGSPQPQRLTLTKIRELPSCVGLPPASVRLLKTGRPRSRCHA